MCVACDSIQQANSLHKGFCGSEDLSPDAGDAKAPIVCSSASGFICVPGKLCLQKGWRARLDRKVEVGQPPKQGQNGKT